MSKAYDLLHRLWSTDPLSGETRLDDTKRKRVWQALEKEIRSYEERLAALAALAKEKP